MDYPEIDDFIIEGEELLISPEAEREIIEYMEKLEEELTKMHAEAIESARKIIIF